MHLIILGFPERLRQRFSMKIMGRWPDFSRKKLRRRSDLSNKMRRRPDYLTKSSCVLCPIDIVCNLFPINHSSESSSFIFSIDWIGLINPVIK